MDLVGWFMCCCCSNDDMQHAMVATTYYGYCCLVIFAVNIVNGAFTDNYTLPDILREIVGDNEYLTTLNLLADASDFISTPKLLLRKSYDFIIVGAGPAGCALAYRLSSSGKFTVLLVEAGQPETFVQRVPAATSLMGLTKYLRSYTMAKIPEACLNINDETCPYVVGEALGGGSVINYLIYTRGNKDDFDRWENVSSSAWSYNSSMALYDSFENQTVSVQYAPYQTDLCDQYLKAGDQLNIPRVNFNRGDQMGIGLSQGTADNGSRVSAAGAYVFQYFPLRTNWHILTDTTVTKILINNTTKAAYGVEFTHDNKNFVTKLADKEVIVSAGPFRSAQLLMVSGIGPREHLLEKNVPFVHDLPVGTFLQDHLAVITPTFIVNMTKLNTVKPRRTLNLKRVGVGDVLKYPFGNGLLTMFLGLEVITFHKTTNTTRPATCPDLELLFLSGGLHSDLGLGFRKTSRIKQSVYDEYFRPIESPDLDAWSAVICHIHPRAVGNITLVDNSMLTDPLVTYPFFEDKRDLYDMIEGIRIIQRYANTPAMQAVDSRIYNKTLPGCDDHEFDTDAYWECYIRSMTTNIMHMVGTNRMGLSPIDSVVDAQLKVHGIRGLRVADSSVIPTTISGHTQAPAYLVGERAARFIRVEHNDWNLN